ncbi:sigma-54-dependent transcriptional regulator [Sediminitomix flava]|uniref:DNA-binding NtrC family response regulator n=1 Tax=Sediminitomix flava TaxID=379075 RepID=A0A315Z011_SEDFL|nr:sigma-54 dependent transcriptional regulator [Sediminitomix flava]PWJ36007.1 DNA-binding NtrC family response regulator [Sediminitomix flava]
MARNKIIGKVLIVDDNEDLLQAARLYLKRHVVQVDIEPDPHKIPLRFANEAYDVVLLDMNFTEDVDSGQEGLYWMDQILQLAPSVTIILITAYGNIDLAVKAVKSGATDFLTKPWDNERLLNTIKTAIELKKVKSQSGTLEINLEETKVIGQSNAMRKVFDQIQRVAPTDASVLLLGENGTGKEVIAKALHEASERKDETFVAVDLGAVTETLFESELFGHTKGSFTDAKTDRIGRFEEADKGTIFLDEIGNLSLPLQQKLLTVLQKREVTKVGSNKETPIDIRLICATNMDLFKMVEEGTFRQDLLFRINTISIDLPPLREREEDIHLLAEYFLEIYAQKYNREITGIGIGALRRMEKYHWHGNVRELQHAIERAVIMANEPILQAEDFQFYERTSTSSSAQEQDLNLNLEDTEKRLIKKALEKHEGNLTHAADELGLTRTSLYRRVKKYGL